MSLPPPKLRKTSPAVKQFYNARGGGYSLRPSTSPMARQNFAIKSVAFVSLGCPKNLVDSERMLGLLAQDGLAVAADPADADAVVVNTCGFLEASKTESLKEIRD